MRLASFLGPWWSLDAAAPEGIRTRKATAPSVRQVLHFTMEKQRQDYWCWAACTASIARFIDANSTWTQCSVASGILRTDCCTDEGACNTTESLEDALDHTKTLDAWHSGTARQAYIVKAIDAQQLVGCLLQRTGGVDHFVVVYGYDLVTQQVFVADPLTEEHKPLAWTAFIDPASSLGVWGATYRAIPAGGRR